MTRRIVAMSGEEMSEAIAVHGATALDSWPFAEEMSLRGDTARTEAVVLEWTGQTQAWDALPAVAWPVRSPSGLKRGVDNGLGI
jgi:hypothetical protein